MNSLILIVDDAIFARNMMQRALKHAGYSNFLEAGTASEALSIYKKHSPDLVLLDVSLPDNPDLTLLNDILEFDENANVIIVSAITQELVMLDALKIGAKDFIVKPFLEDEFIQIVKEHLASEEDA